MGFANKFIFLTQPSTPVRSATFAIRFSLRFKYVKAGKKGKSLRLLILFFRALSFIKRYAFKIYFNEVS